MNVLEVWKGAVLAQNSGCEETFKTYLYALEEFCKFCDTTPEKIWGEWMSVVTYADERKFSKKWNMKIKQYTAWLSGLVWDEKRRKWILFNGDQDEVRMAPNTLRGRLRALGSLVKHLDLPWKIMKPRRAYSPYHNQPITPEEIRAIVKVSRPRDRAMFLMMKDTGLRPGTLVQLPYRAIKNEFEAERVPCKVTVQAPYTKGKYHSYFTFMGAEAIEALNEYFALRGKPEKDEKIFKSLRANKPSTVYQITKQFRKAVLKLGLNKEKRPRWKPSSLRLYTLRKFFRNRAMPAGAEFVQFWMGHTLPMQDNAYFEPNEEEMRKAYARIYPRLAITKQDRDERIISMEKRIEELERLVQKLRTKLEKR